jgi:hypothetical protein
LRGEGYKERKNDTTLLKMHVFHGKRHKLWKLAVVRGNIKFSGVVSLYSIAW